MNFVYGMLLFCVLFWVLFGTGLVHCMRAWSIRKERRYHGTYQMGRKGSPTSNSKKIFQMDIEKAERKITKVVVYGTLRGFMPTRYDVVYLEIDDQRIPVCICRVKKLDMPRETEGVRVSVKVTGIPGKIAARLSDELPKDVHLTNLRVQPRETVVSGQMNRTEIRYPVVVSAPLREILPPAGIAAFGLFGVCIFCWAIAYMREFSGGMMLLMFCGLFVACLGLACLLPLLCFRMRITEEQVEVRGFLKKHIYHINNLRYSVSLAVDKSEKWLMTITDTAGGRVASINSSYPNYTLVYEAFRSAANKRMEEQLRAAEREALRGYLTETVFYIPAEVSRKDDSGETVVTPEIMAHKEDGTRTAFLYDEISAAQDGDPAHPVIRVTVEDALSLMSLWGVDALLVFPTSEELPQSVLINREYWNELHEQ